MSLVNQIVTLGSRGILKSIYHSRRHTDSLTNLALHSNAIMEIHPQTRFEINNRLSLGVSNMGASDPRMGHSLLTTEAGSLIRHTGSKSATIGPESVLHIEGEFSMGDSYINSNCRIICGDQISIGNDVAIAWDVQIIDDDRHRINGKKRTAPIEINDDVWIGHSVSINKGVTIGEGAVVACDSVVTEDVRSGTLVGGCPASVLREDVEWS